MNRYNQSRMSKELIDKYLAKGKYTSHIVWTWERNGDPRAVIRAQELGTGTNTWIRWRYLSPTQQMKLYPKTTGAAVLTLLCIGAINLVSERIRFCELHNERDTLQRRCLRRRELAYKIRNSLSRGPPDIAYINRKVTSIIDT